MLVLSLTAIALVSVSVASPIAQLRDAQRPALHDRPAQWPVLPDQPPCTDCVPYRDPRASNGSMYALEDHARREPLNVIISAQSSPYVLTLDGLLSFVQSLGFDRECAGMHLGQPQTANCDGKGYSDEIIEARQARYRLPIVGTCVESAVGGNHFRAWKQQSTGAWFLAVSLEQSARHGHTIAKDGYDGGRSALVTAAVPSSSYRGKRWRSTVEWLEGLIPPTRDRLNHRIGTNGVGAYVDCVLLTHTVALLTVEIA